MVSESRETVSVVMITYGHQFFIEQAIRGVLIQKGDFDIELIISNDNSPDETDQTVENLRKEFPDHISLKYYSQKVNLGIIRNFTFALKKATGKYIAICEGDDYWTNSFKLRDQFEFLEKNSEFSLVCHNAEVRYDDIDLKPHNFNNIKNSVVLHEEQIINEWIIPTASMFFRRDIIDQLPTWFIQIYSGDYSLALLSMNSGKIYFINESWCMYRVLKNGTSASSYYKDKMIFVYEQHLKLLDYFNEFSDSRFQSKILGKIHLLKGEIRFLKALKKSKINALIFEPKIFLKKVISKIRRK